MNIAIPEYETVWKDPQKNAQQKKRLIAQIMHQKPETDLIVFPELSFHGFVMDTDNQALAESVDGFCVRETQKLAQEYKVNLIVGFIEKSTTDRPFNTAIAIGKKGEILGKYHKNKLFTASKEPELYTAGTTATVFTCAGQTCGLSICFDLRFSSIFHDYRTQGATVMINIANWVDGPHKAAIYQTLSAARAIENQCFFVGVDRVGADPNVAFAGRKGLYNPFGVDMAHKYDSFVAGTFDLDQVDQLRSSLPMV